MDRGSAHPLVDRPQDGRKERGDPVENRSAVTLGNFEGLGTFRVALKDQARTAQRRAQQPGAQAEDVVKCADTHHHIAGRETRCVRRRARGVKKVAVAELDALGLPRGSGSIEDGEGVVRVRRVRREFAAPAGGHEVFPLEDPVVVPQVLFADGDEMPQFGKLDEKVLEALQVVDAVGVLGRNRADRAGVPEHVAQFGTRDTRIQRDHDSAQPGRGEDGDRELGPRRQDDGDPVALANPEIGQ